MKIKGLIILNILVVNLIIFSSVCAIDPCYSTYGEVMDEMRFISLTYPNITRIYTIGYTTGFQLPILAMKISDNPQIREDEPKLLYNGIHHPAEVIGPEICLFLIRDLVSKYEIDSFITSAINSSEIWVIPMVNPDGNYIVHSGLDTMWRKNTRDNNLNGIWDYNDGVNLNRNYDFLWSSGGNTIPADRDYRGPYPFSENETQAIRDLSLREKFIFDICYHSDKDIHMGEAVYYTWTWGNARTPDHNHIKPIADSLAFSIINDAGIGTYYAILGRATEGGLTRHWLYYAVGTFAFTIEVSHGYFPPASQVDSICQRNSVGAYYLLRRSFGSQLTGHITDSLTGTPLVAEVRILEAFAPPETIAPRTSDSLFGRYYRILSPGNYTVQVLKPGYQPELIPNVSVLAGQPTFLEVKLKPSRSLEDKTQSVNRSYENFQVFSSITNKSNKILFSVVKETDVNIKIYAEDGKLIKVFVDQTFLSGKYSFSWDYQDKNGKKVADGVYFIKITTNSFEQTKKIVVVN